MPEGVAAAMAGAEGGGAYLVHAGKRSQVPRGGWMPLRWAQAPSYSHCEELPGDPLPNAAAPGAFYLAES